MRIYTNDVTDWVIAASEEDANAVLCEHYGVSLEKLIEEEWQVTKQWPDDKPLTMHNDEGGEKATRTPAEWIAKEGRGFLGSTEY